MTENNVKGEPGFSREEYRRLHKVDNNILGSRVKKIVKSIEKNTSGSESVSSVNRNSQSHITSQPVMKKNKEAPELNKSQEYSDNSKIHSNFSKEEYGKYLRDINKDTSRGKTTSKKNWFEKVVEVKKEPSNDSSKEQFNKPMALERIPIGKVKKMTDKFKEKSSNDSKKEEFNKPMDLGIPIGKVKKMTDKLTESKSSNNLKGTVLQEPIIQSLASQVRNKG